MGKKEMYINAVISRHMGSNTLNTGDHLNYKSDGINKTMRSLRESSEMRKKSYEYILVLVKLKISFISFWRNLRSAPSMRSSLRT